MGQHEEPMNYFRSKTGMGHGSLCNGASSAFHALLLAQGFQAGDEILFPVECYPTLPMLAIEAGLVPRFVDVDENLNMCPSDLRRALTTRVRAVLVIHMAGYPARMDEIEDAVAASASPSAIIMEDWCQAFGTVLKGGIRKRKASRAVILSFSTGKLISLGGGGLLLSDDPDLVREAEVVINNGYCREKRFRRNGFPYAMHPLQVSALAEALPDVENALRTRDENNARIRALLADSPFEPVPSHAHIHEHKVMARLREGSFSHRDAVELESYFDVGETHYPVKVYEEGYFRKYLARKPDYGPIGPFPRFEAEAERYFAFRTNARQERLVEFLGKMNRGVRSHASPMR